jgi:UDP-N-acetylmuramoylalanine--D-glutamate ligase
VLYGLGLGNDAVKKYFDDHRISYQVYIDGENQFPDPDSYDMIVKSSGIHFETPFLLEAAKFQKPVICDIELAYRLYPNRELITVTGTNGKTTTVNLIYEILKTEKKVLLAGNVGIPVFAVFDEEGLMVVEASSFMLHDIDKYHSHVSVLLNFLPNHLEYHHTFENYMNDKLKLVKRNLPTDYIVYNGDDTNIGEKIRDAEGIKIPFSLTKKVDGAYLSEGRLYFKDQYIMEAKELRIPGLHNIANALASICVAMVYNIALFNIQKILKSFAGVEHRIEDVGYFQGIRIINDSKSTNPHALLTALKALEGRRILLLAGGKDKNDDFTILKGHFGDVVETLLYGQNRKILAGLMEEEEVPYKEFENLEEIMKVIRDHLHDAEVLLFSPGSSSYDQFQNFEKRGEYFKQLIKDYLK